MQDRYAGDIGDFGKIGLLKALQTQGLSVGVNWYRVEPMDTEKKESSELTSLTLTKDFFKKIIVRMDIPHNFYDDRGIFHCSLIDLLLDRVELF